MTVKAFKKRKQRIRNKIRRTANGKPRLTIFRSNKYITVQVIDDINSNTILSASTADDSLKDKNNCNIESAKKLGKLVADKAKKIKLDTVVFDRSGYIYHGKIKAFADAARENGLKF